MKIRFCEKCGRMILVGFEFCPYCGIPIPPPEGAEPSPSAGKSLSGSGASPEGRMYVDRLIQDLEALDSEIAELKP